MGMMNRTRGSSALTLCTISLCAVLGAASCSSPSSRSGNTSSDGQDEAAANGALSPQEAKEYKDIQALYTAGAYEAALKKLAVYEKRYPRSPQLAQIRNIRGLTYLARKDSLKAIYHFRRAVDTPTKNAKFRNFILYNLAAAQFDANQPEDAEKTFDQIHTEDLNKETQMKFYFLRSRIRQKRGQSLEAARDAIKASDYVEDAGNRAALMTQLETCLKGVSDLPALEDLYQDHSDSPVADRVLFHLGARKIQSGAKEQGQEQLKLLVAKYPQSAHYAEAEELLRNPEANLAALQTPSQAQAQANTASQLTQSEVDPQVIGVLLPMTGKFSRYATRTLQGLELAFRIFNGEGAEPKYSLVIEDSGETPAQSLRALEALYFKDHAIGVIGPLLSKGVEQITQRAQELGMPILTLSQQPGVSGDYIFSAGLTPRAQAYEVAKYAIEQLGMRRFAILHPRDKFGEQFSQNYWDAVESLGGKIVGIESYSPGETDFRQPVDKLSGLYYTEARRRELEALAREREVNKIKKRTRKTEQYFALKPIVDYEAVFIPDEPKALGQILPTFAYRDVDNVRFLGIAAWDSPELIQRAQNYAENSVFLDAFSPEATSTSTTVKKFSDGYRETFNQEPSSMEAIAFDAGRVLEQALGASRARSRADLRDALRGISKFPGVTGKISYQEGYLSRDWVMLTVKSGQIGVLR